MSVLDGRFARKLETMAAEYYVIRKEAVPPVLLGVVEANRLLASGRAKTVAEATEAVGISRSSFYKFKDDIEEFHAGAAGTTLTLMLEIDDRTGVLADILKVIAQVHANILTIHQSIPMNGVATVTISIQLLENTDHTAEILTRLEATAGVHKIRVTGRQGI
jgi:chorismate mutase